MLICNQLFKSFIRPNISNIISAKHLCEVRWLDKWYFFRVELGHLKILKKIKILNIGHIKKAFY